jgi:signal transduction histidine kinase
MSRIMTGKLHMKSDEVDLAAVVINAVDTVRAGAAAKDLQLSVTVPRHERVDVTGDADRLQQVVWNLVSNAIKFTPNRGRVEVALARVGDEAELSVRDTGIGIDPSFRPFVFERFRQMDTSTARRAGGLGIGLSIVRHLTEAHGGTVEVESGGPGTGSTFTVRLPLRATKPRRSAKSKRVKTAVQRTAADP